MEYIARGLLHLTVQNNRLALINVNIERAIIMLFGYVCYSF